MTTDLRRFAARIAPVTARVVLSGAGYGGELAACESKLGVPCLAAACRAQSMRAAAHV
jgi:hypothetical protein